MKKQTKRGPIVPGLLAGCMAATLGLLPATAMGHDDDHGGAGDSTGESRSGEPPAPDQAAAQVLTTLHADNQMETELARLAEEKAQAEEVKAFAQHMQQDHARNEQQVVQLAEGMQIDLSRVVTQGEVVPQKPSSNLPSMPGGQIKQEQQERQQQALQELERKSGAQFDQAFLDTVIENHKTSIDELTAARGEVTDPQVRSLIDDSLPVLRDHLAEAESLREQTQGQR